MTPFSYDPDLINHQIPQCPYELHPKLDDILIVFHCEGIHFLTFVCVCLNIGLLFTPLSLITNVFCNLGNQRKLSTASHTLPEILSNNPEIELVCVILTTPMINCQFLHSQKKIVHSTVYHRLR